jgi:16S rRNA C967 or C1407 C5-methylase (RsmB/RsmF family)
MSQSLPPLFLERLQSIIPPQEIKAVLETFSLRKKRTYRINTLKANPEDIFPQFSRCERISWFNEGFTMDETISSSEEECLNVLAAEGKIYRQNLSSILISLFLNPQPGQIVLDLCSAPGSKASHLSALMNNEGKLMCIEPIKGRYYRLRSVLSLLGATNAKCFLADGRRWRPKDEQYDRILVDAPCSSEGRFYTADEESYAYWSPRKIKEMMHKQKGLLNHAARLLKPNGELIYSTCTFSPEENEEVVAWVLLRNPHLTLVSLPDVLKEKHIAVHLYPPLTHWGKKTYPAEINKCIRILPDIIMDAFFIAKFKNVPR